MRTGYRVQPAWGLGASVLVHAVLLALIAWHAPRAAPPGRHPVSPQRPLTVWLLRDAPAPAPALAPVAALPAAARRPALRLLAVPAIVLAPDTPPMAAAPAASAPVLGVAFAPPRAVFGSGTAGWMRPPPAPEPIASAPPSPAEVAAWALQAQRRQFLAAAERVATREAGAR